MYHIIGVFDIRGWGGLSPKPETMCNIWGGGPAPEPLCTSASCAAGKVALFQMSYSVNSLRGGLYGGLFWVQGSGFRV